MGPMGLHDDFSTWLCERLNERKLTQSQFARMVGISPSNITFYLNGSQIPTIKTFLDILEALDLYIVIKEKRTM